MKEILSSIFIDKILTLCACITLFLLIVYFVLGIVFFTKLPPFLPLYNQMPWGDARIGSRMGLFLPFGITCTIFVVNIFFAALFYKSAPLVARILSVTSFLVTSLALLLLARTLLLVLS